MIFYYGLEQFITGEPIWFGNKSWCHNCKSEYLIYFNTYQGAKRSGNNYKDNYNLGGGVLLNFVENIPKNIDGRFYYTMYLPITFLLL